MIKNQKIMLLSIKRQYELVTTDFWDDFFEIYKEDKTIKFFIDEVINGSLIDHQLYINKDINIKRWFDEVTEILFSARYAPEANYANQQYEQYISIGAFGTGCLFIDELPALFVK